MPVFANYWGSKVEWSVGGEQCQDHVKPKDMEERIVEGTGNINSLRQSRQGGVSLFGTMRLTKDIYHSYVEMCLHMYSIYYCVPVDAPPCKTLIAQTYKIAKL